jgi:GT2 family glycosyltransferase
MLRALQADRRDMQLAAADKGLSFAAAANLGARHARGRWLLFLDPHVVLQRGAVARLAAAGGGANTLWIVGGRLTDIAGRERRAARAGSLNAFSSIAVAIDWPMPQPARQPARKGERSSPSEATRAAAVSGAFMLMPRGVFQTLGGFDEAFATDAADLDLCRRAAEAGGSILFQPDAAGLQFGRSSGRGRKQAQGLALFAAKSARTPLERAFALVARPALSVVLGLRDLVAGRQPIRR